MKFKLLAACAAAIALSACKPNVSSEVYLADIEDVIQKGAPVEYTGTISSTVMLTVDDCNKKLTDMVKAIASMEPGVKSRGCAKSGTDTVVTMEVPVTLRKAGDKAGAARLVALEVSKESEGTVVNLRAISDLDLLRKEIASKTFFSINLDEMTIASRLVNDGRDPVTVKVRGVMANGEAILPKGKDFPVQRRQPLELRLSNVHTAAFVKGEPVEILTIGNGATN